MSTKKTAKPTDIEKLLGPTLLTKLGATQSTSTVLKGKDLVALYFSASWCPPCKAFTPVLIDFYKSSAVQNKVEIVYVSSDRDLTSFNEYYGKMPWAAIPSYAGGSAQIKQNLANALKIQGIPSLVVLDAKTGKFVTDAARNDVMSTGGVEDRGNELIATWKSKEAVPLEEATFSADDQSMLVKIAMFFARNPLYIVGLIYIVKKGLKILNDLGKDDEQEGEL